MTRRPVRRFAVVAAMLGAVCALITLTATPALAGPNAAQAPAPRGGRAGLEVGLAATAVGPVNFGDGSQDLATPDGGALTLFHTRNRLATTPGVEADVGLPLFWGLRAEAVGGWSRTSLRTDVSADFEGASDTGISTPVTRYTAGGAVLWTALSRGRADLFLRGGAAWMRELADGAALAQDGIEGDLGIGVKYWWHGSRDRRGRLALRAEARATARSRALTIGPSRVRIAPAVAVGLTFGF
jgi:hypothetical protein